MALFLDGLTFTDQAREVTAPDWPVPIRLKPFQVLLWISLSQRGLEQLPADAPRLPALLDPGQNYTVALGEQQLHVARLATPYSWGTKPLRVRDSAGTERPIERLFVDVWLHANVPDFAGRPHPVRLGARGAACYPTGGAASGPPLPLVGMAAMCLGSLTVQLECRPTGGTARVHVPDTPAGGETKP